MHELVMMMMMMVLIVVMVVVVSNEIKYNLFEQGMCEFPLA